MSRSVLALILATVLLASGAAAQNLPSAALTAVVPGFRDAPLLFLENRGLYPDAVAYHVKGRDRTLFFTAEGMTVALESPAQRWAVQLDFLGARAVRPEGRNRQAAVFSYFLGRPKDWQTGVPAFAKIVYEDLWPGIDLVYRGTVRYLKYEFVVRPGANPAQIQLRYRGLTRAFVTPAGALRVETPAGGFEDAPPVAWQEVDGRRASVAMAYDVGPAFAEAGAVTYGFRLGAYDPTRTLVLDPALLVYCGYLGGNDYDDNYGTAVDAQGNVYVTGEVDSAAPSFPAAVGPDLTYHGNGDAYVAKVDRNGQLVYCGYLGGTDYEYGAGVAVDAQGQAYVVGYTESDAVSEGFPVKVGPDLTYNGTASGGGDGFIAKVNAAGTGLDYCGYLGGINDDYAWGVAVDAAGNAYVVGDTQSDQTTFPVRVGPDLTFNDTSSSDAFVAKVNTAGTALDYCGYIGGAQYDGGWGRVAVDAQGNAYVCGETSSNETTDKFPVLVGPDLAFNGGTDVFVAKVNAVGTALDYCGYLGGTGWESTGGIAVDATGCAYVCGSTDSTEQSFPVRVGPDLTYNDTTAISDAFVAKVNALGTALVYCGYIGGAQWDDGWGGVGVDGQGNAYVCGGTESNETTDSFPVRVGPDLTYNGWNDGFVARVNAAGTALDYCGYIGGTDYDSAWSIAVDAAGNAYVSGDTDSYETTNLFPVTGGPDLTFNGITDAWVSKVAFVNLTSSGAPRPGNRVTLALTATGDAGLAYQVGSSLGTGPIPIGPRSLGLSPDTLLVISTGGMLPQIFTGYAGVLSGVAQGQASLAIPNDQGLVGIRIHSAFVTLYAPAPFGLKSISNTASFTITR
ncbi:MAG: SBBP repeat-containing protein [Planctomycetes bacterium]|nr:SBBP repeat-containing protein [Planctomycetota bacterium]